MAELLIRGEILAPGMAVGRVCFFNNHPDSSGDINERPYSDISGEIDRFDREIERLKVDLQAAVKILQIDSLYEAAEIIQTHVLILEDEDFLNRVHEQIRKNHLAAEIALEYVLGEIIDILEKSENSLVSQRTADIRDIMLRLKMNLKNEDQAVFKKVLSNVSSPVVVLKELLPSMVLEARESKVSGLLVSEGTSLSHAAILAKSFGIPILRITNLRQAPMKYNQEVLIDAITGRLVLNPTKESIQALKKSKKIGTREKPLLPVGVWANIIDPEQVNRELLLNTEGIGLYRTEFLFMRHQEGFPDEETQYSVYSSLFEKCGNSPVTVRTLDIGGDKTLPYFSFGPQDNPFLGLRAHRIYRFHPEILLTQLRAILRAAVKGGQLRILFPMIESVDELLFLKELLSRAEESLKSSGTEYMKNYQQGILIEVPSAVWSFNNLLQLVDFASIGTNDLFQYFFAVDRNNANVQHSYQPENPAALRMLKSLVDTAAEADKPLNICGETASDLHYLPLLIGLGFDNISIDFHMLNPVIEVLKNLDVPGIKKVVQRCLSASTFVEVRNNLEEAGFAARLDAAPAVFQEQETIDPVCKMVVHTRNNRFVAEKKGKKYYFCSQDCMNRFLNDGNKEQLQNEK